MNLHRMSLTLFQLTSANKMAFDVRFRRFNDVCVKIMKQVDKDRN